MPMAKHMIKMSSKRAAAGAAVGIFVLLASVVPAFALETRPIEPRDRETRDDGASNVCERIMQASEKLLVRLDERKADISKRSEERREAVAERRSEHRDTAVERRENWNTRWDALILKLQAKAETDVQKAAIAQFKIAMQTAFNARQTALDAANTAFRTVLDKAVAERKAAVQSAADTLKGSVKTALAKANADCQAGVAGATVRAALKTSLDAAHAKFRTDVQAADKIGVNARTQAETRRAAVEKAKTEFKAAALKARDALKAALNAESSASAPETQP